MKLNFYNVDSHYCDFLRQIDHRVPYTYDEKSTCPFVGIVLSIHNVNYFAPLTSPKTKHLKMKNQIDFIKIEDGKLGAINFNNMIPVHSRYLHKVDLHIYDEDTQRDIAYKNLLQDQLSWCVLHQKQLTNAAERLYDVVTNGRGWENLKSCDFKKVEKQAEKRMK